ncbi:NAD(P)-dependent dehydrogenase (short-subunit alcohol dehydrogenase family) [Paracidovorax citrulli]|nr:NAD(P)-dependent dehydrogenase (short-subunit alcohol dehydrogenase family) [Paracidovorax citrulli]QCX11917.1 3-oxoacyl-[acyl-carrier-protein] reductase FabG [Paracidovorax citrulli]REG69651.1 NAD(P)-dependent dehydrogenase (short-subunit alcohol dehydrogenase family) [Paracidovorax citrulli]RLJ94205.1 NAD(P)-dependent dehydrogenase (short-subunit alcohol dehydrogenase family) [Paracidovorax citrulli]SDK63191.1 NAD(P)-dependent dehydrogenase, short-chain alcohol dehydrogenase family [Paraci
MPSDALPAARPVPHAVVTGSSSGIGRAIAESLLATGWRVTGLDIAPPAIAHPAFAHLPVDLADGEAIARAAAGLLEADPREIVAPNTSGHASSQPPNSPPAPQAPDALVHAAGVLRVGPLGQLDHAGGALMWRLHVDAATRLADALVPAMAARGRGRVVFIGSRVAQGMPGRGQYAATKAALIALARSWAAEVAGQGVTVNVVSPAATATGMLADPARAGSAPRLPPIGRLIDPAEIAALTGYLLSPAAAAITGQDIAICGGSSLAR